MPGIKKTLYSPLYSALQQEANAAQEDNDCAVKALSIVMNVPYAEVLKVLNKEGRKPRGATCDSQMIRTLRHFGFGITYVYAQTFIKQYPKSHQILKNVTSHHPRRFPKVWGKVESPILMFTHTHVAAFKDGEIHDWMVNRAMKIQYMWMIRKL